MNVSEKGQLADEFSIVALFYYHYEFLVAVLESYDTKLTVSVELAQANRAQCKRFLISLSY